MVTLEQKRVLRVVRDRWVMYWRAAADLAAIGLCRFDRRADRYVITERGRAVLVSKSVASGET